MTKAIHMIGKPTRVEATLAVAEAFHAVLHGTPSHRLHKTASIAMITGNASKSMGIWTNSIGTPAFANSGCIIIANDRTQLSSSGLILSAICSQSGDPKAEEHSQYAVNSRTSGAHIFHAAAWPADHVIREMNDNSSSWPKHTREPT
jgi:hypothetical protein